MNNLQEGRYPLVDLLDEHNEVLGPVVKLYLLLGLQVGLSLLLQVALSLHKDDLLSLPVALQAGGGRL